jgi:hypothetical protein
MLAYMHRVRSSNRGFAHYARHMFLFSLLWFAKADLCARVAPTARQEPFPGAFTACGVTITCTCEQDAYHAFAYCRGSREFCAKGVCATYSAGSSVTFDSDGKAYYDYLRFVTYTGGQSGSFIIAISGVPTSVNGQSCTRIPATCTDGSRHHYDDCSNIQAGAFVDMCNFPYFNIPSNDPNHIFFGVHISSLDSCNCRANGARCTAPTQCCGTGKACDGRTRASRVCKACLKRSRICARPSQCCSRRCINRRCA